MNKWMTVIYIKIKSWTHMSFNLPYRSQVTGESSIMSFKEVLFIDNLRIIFDFNHLLFNILLINHFILSFSLLS